MVKLISCPIPEVARLGKTLRRWKQSLPGLFPTHGSSNGGAEAVNGSSNYTDASLRDYLALDSYRLRILLVAGGLTPVIPTERPNVRQCWLSGPAARRTPAVAA